MSRACLAAMLSLGFLGTLALPYSRAQAEKAPEHDNKQQAGLQRIQQLLDEQLVETSHFHVEMPLGKFLTALEKQLPKEKTLALRIDGEAFGNKLDEVAATPMVLPAIPKKTSLRRVLEVAIAKSKTNIDYRLDAGGVTVTTRR